VRKTTIAINVIALLVTIPMAINMGSEFMPRLTREPSVHACHTSIGVHHRVNRVMQVQDGIIVLCQKWSKCLAKWGRPKLDRPCLVSMIGRS
jgi:Cu(I)/Ag(I) efflux system membrane protein CusA/SilA